MNKETDARAKVAEKLWKAMMIEPVGKTVAVFADCGDQWTVKVDRIAQEYFSVSGRGTQFEVWIHSTVSGYLVSVPNFKRCGHVPADCRPWDVVRYIGIDNPVDAITLAAGIRYILDVYRL